jgi:rubrerythrin
MDLKNVIDGCIQMEQTVASIYSMFMQLFPEEKMLWEDLLRDETDHALWLTDANYIESIDLLPSNDILPSMKQIEHSLKFADNKRTQIKINPVTMEEALNIALKLEETMVEAFANELKANLFSSDYSSLCEKLLIAEKLHIDKIEDMMMKKGFLQLT